VSELTPTVAAEGAIQFAYGLSPSHETGEFLDADTFADLRAWRRVLRRQGLVGRDPRSYGGLGYGNLSVRDPADSRRFVITASQTGGARDLRHQDLVRIVSLSLARFWVEAEGRKPPSSETLSHAMVYPADDSVRWVFHVHAREIWQQADMLGLPGTAAHVPYGSRAMADAVAALLQNEPRRPIVFTTRGHEDGVFACGEDAEATGVALLSVLARALRR
jgi:hypothetical protein